MLDWKAEMEQAIGNPVWAPALCGNEYCQKLHLNVHTRDPHSVDAVKDFQCNYMKSTIEKLLRTRPRVNILLFDDTMCRNGSNVATLLAEDIILEFGSRRVAIWSPNIKAEIVALSRNLADRACANPWLTTGYGCFCHFINTWAEDIRAAGGFDIVFADCFGCLANGAGKLMADLVARRLFRKPSDLHDRRPCHVLWAVSDLPERLGSVPETAANKKNKKQSRNVGQIIVKMQQDVADIFLNDDYYFYCQRMEKPYGNTMHFVAIEVHETRMVPPAGFIIPEKEVSTRSSGMP